jgi:hypothetical protein
LLFVNNKFHQDALFYSWIIIRWLRKLQSIIYMSLLLGHVAVETTTAPTPLGFVVDDCIERVAINYDRDIRVCVRLQSDASGVIVAENRNMAHLE